MARRSCRRSTAGASSSACTSRCPGAGRARWSGCSARAACSRSCAGSWCVAVLAGLWPVYERGLESGPLPWSDIDPAVALVWAVGAGCALGAAWQAKFHRLVALVADGRRGARRLHYFRLVLGARSRPDTAPRRDRDDRAAPARPALAAKRVPVIGTAAGARAALPRRLRDVGHRSRRGRRACRARLCGDDAAASRHTISRFFVARAYPEGGGTNVVNVILVDFRGFDTLGEITVLGVVAVAVYSLLRRFRPARESIEVPQQQRRAQSAAASAEDLLVPALIMRLMFPVIGMLAAVSAMRGHNLPGGGFVAGSRWRWRSSCSTWPAARAGWRTACGSSRCAGSASGSCSRSPPGPAAWFFAHPFLTSHTPHVELPLIGALHLPSAFLFDLGVFALVVGATGADPDRARPPVGPQPPRRRRRPDRERS